MLTYYYLRSARNRNIVRALTGADAWRSRGVSTSFASRRDNQTFKSLKMKGAFALVFPYSIFFRMRLFTFIAPLQVQCSKVQKWRTY